MILGKYCGIPNAQVLSFANYFPALFRHAREPYSPSLKLCFPLLPPPLFASPSSLSCVKTLHGVAVEFLPNAAGEDVVAGIRTPQPLEEMAQKWPDVYAELFKYQEQLEAYYGDMQVCSVAKIYSARMPLQEETSAVGSFWASVEICTW